MANRLWLAVTGLVFLAAGGAVPAAALGAFGPERAHRPVCTAAMSRWITAHARLWPAVVAAGCVVTLLGIGWLAAQGRGVVLRRLAMGGPGADATRMGARVAVRTIGADVASYEGVRAVRGRLVGRPARPRVHLRVTCDETADLAGLAVRIRREALAALRATLDRADLTAVVVFAVEPARPAREERADKAGGRRSGRPSISRRLS